MSDRQPQTNDEALDLARQVDRVLLADHARQRCRERGVDEGTIKRALRSATRARRGDGARWRIFSRDQDGDPMVMVVEFDTAGVSPAYDRTVVVTILDADDG